MFFVLSGRGNTGKDSVANALVNLGYYKIPTYTTRKPRCGEVDGYTYNFITNEEFQDKLDNGFFLEYQEFDKSDEGTVRYGSSYNSLINAKRNYFIILTPSGIEKLRQSNIHATVFLIECSDQTIKARQIVRGDATKEENERRFKQDKEDFKDIAKLIDYKVVNENRSPVGVAEEIIRLYENINLNT